MAGVRLPELNRRNILIGGGAGIGLLVAWQYWPRHIGSRLNARKGEQIFGPYVKIGLDGRVTVAVPQSELGQGVYTTLPQIVADELGADWHSVGVEAAPYGPEYDNTLLSPAWQDGWFDHPLMITGGSTTVRAYERPLREAGAAARVLLCKAGAARFDADWQICDTANGHVTRGDDRIAFRELVVDAAKQTLPSGPVPLRVGTENRLAGGSLPRLDVPAKVDGSAQFAADVRLPDMVFAAIAQGPLGDVRYASGDEAAARKVQGVLGIEKDDHWVACVAANWWAASRGIDVLKPRFKTTGALQATREIDRALDNALLGGERVVATGNAEATLVGGQALTADYRVGLLPHAALEPMAATAAFADGKMQLWIACHAPELAVKAVARATGLSAKAITVHPMLAGGSFGRRYEVEVAAQVAVLAQRLKRPVQLTWSRAEDIRQDRYGPAVAVRLSARLAAGGRIDGWLAKIAAPATFEEMKARVQGGVRPDAAMRAAKPNAPMSTSGATPPYAIPNLAVDYAPAMIGIPTGDWRGGADVANAFARECFVDELAAMASYDPFAFRLGLLGGNPRLAQCLLRATALGNWQGGGPASGQGIACHTMAGSHIAVIAEAMRGEDGTVRVTRLVAVVDCGRVINPGIVRQQIAGGLMFGLSAVTGAPIEVAQGRVSPERMGALKLPRLADSPWITIELVRSNAAPGGVSELAVPPTAPAIINALAAGSGARIRNLPVRAA